jgi:hypothetical protein
MKLTQWFASASLLGVISVSMPMTAYAQAIESTVRTVTVEDYGVSFEIPAEYVVPIVDVDTNGTTIINIYSPSSYESEQECRQRWICTILSWEFAELAVWIQPATSEVPLREQAIEEYSSAGRMQPIALYETTVSEQSALVFLGDFGNGTGYSHYTSFLTPDLEYRITIQVAPEYEEVNGQYQVLESPQHPELRDMVLGSFTFDAVAGE